jgi:hypothetical protein
VPFLKEKIKFLLIGKWGNIQNGSLESHALKTQSYQVIISRQS